MSAETKHTTRCYTHGCGRFAKTPENSGNPAMLSAFPECAQCAATQKLRRRRAANLMRNLSKADGG